MYVFHLTLSYGILRPGTSGTFWLRVPWEAILRYLTDAGETFTILSYAILRYLTSWYLGHLLVEGPMGGHLTLSYGRW